MKLLKERSIAWQQEMKQVMTKTETRIRFLKNEKACEDSSKLIIAIL